MLHWELLFPNKAAGPVDTNKTTMEDNGYFNQKCEVTCCFFSIPEEVSKIMLNLFDPVHVIVV